MGTKLDTVEWTRREQPLSRQNFCPSVGGGVTVRITVGFRHVRGNCAYLFAGEGSGNAACPTC